MAQSNVLCILLCGALVSIQDVMAQSNVLCTLLWGALVFYTRCDGSVKCPVYIVMGSFSFLYKM